MILIFFLFNTTNFNDSSYKIYLLFYLLLNELEKKIKDFQI